MPRGLAASVGDTRVAPNGYHYTKTEEGWRLTHHLVAEKKLGRKLKPNERVSFVDGDRQNLTKENVRVALRGNPSLTKREAYLEARIEELQAELAYVRSQIKA